MIREKEEDKKKPDQKPPEEKPINIKEPLPGPVLVPTTPGPRG